MIIQFPETHGKVYAWARAYATLAYQKGMIAAGRYSRMNIPEQFHRQLDPIIRKEYIKLKNKKETE